MSRLTALLGSPLSLFSVWSSCCPFLTKLYYAPTIHIHIQWPTRTNHRVIGRRSRRRRRISFEISFSVESGGGKSGRSPQSVSVWYWKSAPPRLPKGIESAHVCSVSSTLLREIQPLRDRVGDLKGVPLTINPKMVEITMGTTCADPHLWCMLGKPHDRKRIPWNRLSLWFSVPYVLHDTCHPHQWFIDTFARQLALRFKFNCCLIYIGKGLKCSTPQIDYRRAAYRIKSLIG